MKNPETIASAIRIGNPASWDLALEAREATDGWFGAIDDDRILAAQKLLAGEVGIFVEPASAISVAGLLDRVEAGVVPAGARVVLTVTGHGLKDPQWALRNADGSQVEPTVVDATTSDVASVLGPGAAGGGDHVSAAPAALPELVEGRTVVVRVPATSANLGPGFDTLGLALSVYDELVVTTLAEGELEIDVSGEGAADVPRDASNLVVRSIAFAFEAVGRRLPGLRLEARNVIPHGRGLGSSGAAVVSGLLAAKGLLEGEAEFGPDTLLRLATELEGHPDNVAPALFGGPDDRLARRARAAAQEAPRASRRVAAGVRARDHDVDERRTQPAAPAGAA